MAYNASSNRIRVAGRWQLTLVPGWAVQEGRSSIALFRQEDGVGAVTISSMRSARGRAVVEPASVVAEFAEGLGLQPVDTVAQIAPPPECLGAAQARFTKTGQHWLVHVVTAPGAVLVVSYNCASEVQHREEAEVLMMLGSVRVDAA